jgi:hypothetical protein
MTNKTSHSGRSPSKLIVPAPPEIVRPTFEEVLRHGNLDGEFKFLTYPGILDLRLADGVKTATLPDIHVPAHDKKAMWAVKQALRDYRPDVLVLIGDVADCFAISAWPADPTVKRDFQAELEETRELIDELREVSGAKWVYIIMGNHEDRIWRYLTNVAPHLANVINPVTRERAMSIHDLLGYGPKDNVTFIYDMGERGGFGGGLLVNKSFKWHHGNRVRPKPAASPRADSDYTGLSTEHGHTHRLGFAFRETAVGEIMASEIGNLVDENHPCLAYSNLRNNHHQGIALARVVGGKVHSQIYPIVEMEVEGRLTKVLAVDDKVYLSADR